MPTFALRPNSKFNTTLFLAVNDTTSTVWSVNAVPSRVPCVLIIDPGASTQEKVKVTGKTSNTITVVRNFDGAGVFTHNIGASIVDYDSPEYITTIADLLEQNFNTDYTPLGTVILTTLFASFFTNFVSSGLTIPVPSPVSLTGTIAAGVAYYGGNKYSVATDGGHAYTASQDTYVDVNPATGAFTYNGVANGAAAPALTASSIRIAKVITNGTQITSTIQGGTDSLGNFVYPNKPGASLLDAYRFWSLFGNYIFSGLTAPTSANLSTTIVAGVVFYGGLIFNIATDGGHTYTASNDCYVDLNPVTGAFTYNTVANGAAAPALTANSIRIAKVVTNGTAVTSVIQDGSYDSLQNILYPTDPRAINTQYYTPAAAGTATLNFAGNAKRHVIQMPAGNITIALPTGYIPQFFEIEIIQDGVGSRTVTWFSTINWKGGTAPTLTTTASKKDIFGFINRSSGVLDGYTIDTNH